MSISKGILYCDVILYYVGVIFRGGNWLGYNDNKLVRCCVNIIYSIDHFGGMCVITQ